MRATMLNHELHISMGTAIPLQFSTVSIHLVCQAFDTLAPRSALGNHSTGFHDLPRENPSLPKGVSGCENEPHFVRGWIAANSTSLYLNTERGRESLANKLNKQICSSECKCGEYEPINQVKTIENPH